MPITVTHSFNPQIFMKNLLYKRRHTGYWLWWQMKDTDLFSEPAAYWERRTHALQSVTSMEEANRVLRQKAREWGASTSEAVGKSVSEDRKAKKAWPMPRTYSSTVVSVPGKSADVCQGSPSCARSLRPVRAERSRYRGAQWASEVRPQGPAAARRRGARRGCGQGIYPSVEAWWSFPFFRGKDNPIYISDDHSSYFEEMYYRTWREVGELVRRQRWCSPQAGSRGTEKLARPRYPADELDLVDEGKGGTGDS